MIFTHPVATLLFFLISTAYPAFATVSVLLAHGDCRSWGLYWMMTSLLCALPFHIEWFRETFAVEMRILIYGAFIGTDQCQTSLRLCEEAWRRGYAAITKWRTETQSSPPRDGEQHPFVSRPTTPTTVTTEEEEDYPVPVVENEDVPMEESVPSPTSPTRISDFLQEPPPVTRRSRRTTTTGD